MRERGSESMIVPGTCRGGGAGRGGCCFRRSSGGGGGKRTATHLYRGPPKVDPQLFFPWHPEGKVSLTIV